MKLITKESIFEAFDKFKESKAPVQIFCAKGHHSGLDLFVSEDMKKITVCCSVCEHILCEFPVIEGKNTNLLLML